MTSEDARSAHTHCDTVERPNGEIENNSRSAGLSQRASTKYRRKYVDGTLQRLDTNPKFHNKQDAADARQAAEEALEVYKKL